MGRTVSYSVVKRNNPLDQDAVPKFYAQAQANGHVEIREMADRIQKTCTVTRADVMAVLVALEDVIMEALEGGEIVRLADLGTFQIGLSGRGAETEDAYLSLIHISEPTRQAEISYAVFCLKKKKKK